MNAVNIQSPQLSIERGSAHAKCFSRRFDITFGTHESSVQHPTLRRGKVFCYDF